MKNNFNYFHNYNFSNKEKNFNFRNSKNNQNNFFEICFKCSEKSNLFCQIKHKNYFLCYKCYQHWRAVRAKHYQLAITEFLATPRESKEKENE